MRALNVSEALALTFLGATGNTGTAAESLASCLPSRDGDYWVEHVVDRFYCYLGGDTPRAANLSWLEQVDANQTITALQTRREPAPSAVIWVVTIGCNRRCPYCYYSVFDHAADREDSPTDATLPFQAAIGMVKEMGSIGASDLYLTGGEPLLRRDLPQIIAAATAHRVRTHLTTKYSVDSLMAKQLAEAGLTSVKFSLDDAREDRAAALAGAHNFLAEARQAIQSFLDVGIDLAVNAVITKKNADGLENLVELLIELGAPHLTLSPYCLPTSPTLTAQSLAAGDFGLKTRIPVLQDRYGDRIDIKAGLATIPKSGETCSTVAVCDVGLRELHVLPCGGVTRCRYLPDKEELVVGSLRDQTILDVWNGQPLAALNQPIKERYAGSACTDCSRFYTCNSRGRCYCTALSRHEMLYAPDEFCQLETSF